MNFNVDGNVDGKVAGWHSTPIARNPNAVVQHTPSEFMVGWQHVSLPRLHPGTTKSLGLREAMNVARLIFAESIQIPYCLT